MKLAFCLFKYFPYGGLQRDFMRIARQCQQLGHEIHVYTMKWEGEQEAGFHIHLIKAKGWQNHTRCRDYIKQVQVALQKEQYDRVIGFNKMPGLDVYYAADVCFKARVREKHSLWYQLLPRYRHLYDCEKAVFNKEAATQILMIAANQQVEFQRYYQTPTSRFHLLPPGISKDRIAPHNAKEIRFGLRCEFGITEKDHLLLMVGSGFKTKGLDRALYAMAALPSELRQQTRLFVIGQDNPTAFITLAEKLGINDQVIFLGGRPDVARFLLGADLLIHPAYHENTGTVLLEALVAGLPVLTVDVCGYAHYIAEADAGCVLTSPFEQATLNNTLKEMLTSSQKERWKENGIAFAQTADLYSMPAKAAAICLAPKLVASFDDFMKLTGECYRNQKGRLTSRIELDNKYYFIKQHHGVGWKEIFKNLLQGRLPVLSAKNEWLAIEKLASLQIHVPKIKSYDCKGLNPANKKSYIVMEEIAPAISLEDLSKTWKQTPPTFHFKKQLISEVAKIARTLHQNGLNHRDFYICHFLLDTSETAKHQPNPILHLIDLHRAQIRSLTPVRWIIKDLAGLFFSSKDIGLTQRDLYRFICAYHQLPLKAVIDHQGLFWNKVKTRGEQLYHDHSN